MLISVRATCTCSVDGLRLEPVVNLSVLRGSGPWEVWEAEKITFSVLSELAGKVGSRVGKVDSNDPW